jgi:hypothetical protein
MLPDPGLSAEAEFGHKAPVLSVREPCEDPPVVLMGDDASDMLKSNEGVAAVLLETSAKFVASLNSAFSATACLSKSKRKSPPRRRGSELLCMEEPGVAILSSIDVSEDPKEIDGTDCGSARLRCIAL